MKRLNLGDKVKIIRGRHRGEIGVVVIVQQHDDSYGAVDLEKGGTVKLHASDCESTVIEEQREADREEEGAEDPEPFDEFTGPHPER